MTEEQIYKKIEEIYHSEKGKNFIIHLLRSFFPIYKSTYLCDTPKNGEIKCCITGEKLSSKQMGMEIMMSDEMKDVFIDRLKAAANEEEYEFPKEIKDKIYPLAISCERSDKYLSKEAFQELLNFYQNTILMGDKKIEWISNNERAKEVVQKGKDENIIQTKKEEKAVHKVIEHTKATFGDIQALQDLKKKLENEEKNETR